jgi:tripartite-type tricarboxylate transporter receptor subunit TctC
MLPASKDLRGSMFARRRFVRTAAAALVAAPAVAHAQKFPSGRVTLVVPFPAGAATDIIKVE